MVLIKTSFIIISFISLIYFMAILTFINTKNSSNKQNMCISNFFANVYILVILILILISSASPDIICERLKKKFFILLDDRGKICLLFCISLLFLNAKNKIILFFGIFMLLSSVYLFLILYLFSSSKNDYLRKNEKIDKRKFIDEKKSDANINEVNTITKK